MILAVLSLFFQRKIRSTLTPSARLLGIKFFEPMLKRTGLENCPAGERRFLVDAPRAGLISPT